MRTKTMSKALLFKNLYPFPHKRKFAVSNVMDNPKWNKRAQLKAAYALNLCAVSLSKIIDYANVDVLRSEYDAILNNLNIGNIIKDEPLLDAFKKILDTCHFFILHAKDKEMLKKKQDARLKGALTQALGGGIAVFGSTNPWAIAAGAVAMLGVAAVNYKAQRDKAKLDNEIEAWELEKSALEQLHNLRRQLFETAWRLSDAYRFPDEYRLTEVQIKDYTDILQDDDPLNRYERLSLIKDYFQAYPLFWYYLGRAALECAKCYCENAGDGDQKHHEGDLCDKPKNAQKNLNGFVEEAKKAYSKFKELHNGNSLFRVDLVAASAYLDIAQLRNLEKNLEKEDSVFGSTDAIFEDIQNAQKLSGTDTDVMQACAFRYLELLDRYSSVENKSKTDECFKRAEYCLKFLLSRDVSVAINGRALSYLYIKMSDLYKDESARGEGVCRSYGILKACTSRKCSFVYQRMYPWDEKSFNDDCKKYFNGAGLRRTAFNYFYALIWLANSEFLCALDQAKAERSYAPLKALRDRRASDKLPSTKELLNAIINDAIKINNDISLSISSSQKMISDFVKNRWMNVGDNGDCETGYEVLSEIEKKFLDDSSQRIWYTFGFGTRVSDFGPDEDFQKDEAKLMNKIKDQAKKAAEAFVDEFRGRFMEYSNEYHFSEDCNSSSEPDSDIKKISMNDLDSLKKIKSEPQAIKDILFLEEEAERLRLRIQEMLSSKKRFWFPDSGFEDDSSQIQTLVLYHQDNQAVVKTINKTPIWNRIIQPVITQINTIFSSKGKNKEA